MSDPVTRLTTVLADRYRVEKELGRGGMAMVYLAQDLRHERKVALKVLRPELAAAIGPDRFLQEIKVTANLQHPHILGLIDSGQADGKRDSLFAGSYVPNPTHINYDVDPSGDHFLMVRMAERERRAVVVFNWSQELAGTAQEQH